MRKDLDKLKGSSQLLFWSRERKCWRLELVAADADNVEVELQLDLPKLPWFDPANVHALAPALETAGHLAVQAAGFTLPVNARWLIHRPQLQPLVAANDIPESNSAPLRRAA